MHIKNVILASTLSLSFISAPLAFAGPGMDKAASSTENVHQCRQGSHGVLTSEQREEMHAIMKDLQAQLAPLMKEKRALKLQLMGKLATPNTQWNDIASLVNSINENNAKITTLITKTQLSTFQKLGVLLPLRHGKHHHAHYMSAKRHYA